MDILIIKLGATGDVVGTTPLLRQLEGRITWLTADKNAVLLRGMLNNVRCLPWEDRDQSRDRHYDLTINLEDTTEAAQFLSLIDFTEIFGAYVDSDGRLVYTDSSKEWFDLSLISAYGKAKADQLKSKPQKLSRAGFQRAGLDL